MSTNYNGDLTWDGWTNALTNNANSLLNDLSRGKAWYNKWYTLTYGLTDAQIQALPQFTTHTVADITAMRYAFGVFNELYQALYNLAALPQSNREGYLVPFLS